MTYRIRIAPNAMVDGIDVQVAHRVGDVSVAILFTEERELATANLAPARASLRIPDDLGRALLDALAGYYGGTTGGLQQRADFEHERSRVDRLIGHLTRPGGTTA